MQDIKLIKKSVTNIPVNYVPITYKIGFTFRALDGLWKPYWYEWSSNV